MTAFRSVNELLRGAVPDARALARELLPPALADRPLQLGVAVDDIQAASRRLTRAGLGPFFRMEGDARWTERGQRRAFRGQIALAYAGSTQLELLGPGMGSRFYSDAMRGDGVPHLHHLGVMVDDLVEAERSLCARGFEVAVRGTIARGPLRVDFVYLDARQQHGLYLELIASRLAGTPTTMSPRMVALGARLQALGAPVIGAPTSSVRTELLIPASPEEIWATLIDIPRWREWNPIITDVTADVRPRGRMSFQIHIEGMKPMRFDAPFRQLDPPSALSWGDGIPGVFGARHTSSTAEASRRTLARCSSLSCSSSAR